MGSPRAISSIQSLTLELPPSCVEFCPAHPEYLVIGTYSLEQTEALGDGHADEDDNSRGQETRGSQERHGTLLVYQLRNRRL